MKDEKCKASTETAAVVLSTKFAQFQEIVDSQPNIDIATLAETVGGHLAPILVLMYTYHKPNMIQWANRLKVPL